MRRKFKRLFAGGGFTGQIFTVKLSGMNLAGALRKGVFIEGA